MTEASLDDFISLLRRDLGASEVHVQTTTDATDARDACVLRHPLPGGRMLSLRFDEPPQDLEARRRRLAMLVESFPSVLSPKTSQRASQKAPAHSLHEELLALCHRADAADALVIDAHSPVVWGTAGEERDVPTEQNGAEEDEGTGEAAKLLLVPGRSGGGASSTETGEQGGRGAEVIQLKPGVPAAKSLAESSEVAQQARHFGLGLVERLWVTPGALELLPRALCQKHRIIPLERHRSTLILAMADPQRADALYDVVRVTGLNVEPVVAGESMRALLERWPERGDTRSYDEVIAGIDPAVREANEAKARELRDAWLRHLSSRRAIAAVRALPELETLHRGGHVQKTSSDADFGYMARSFAGIYVLVLIFDGPFEELRAKRAMMHALPTIERLVLALPPLDPSPMAGAAAMRGRRRRR